MRASLPLLPLTVSVAVALAAACAVTSKPAAVAAPAPVDAGALRHLRLVAAPPDGDAAALIAGHVAASTAAHRVPLVYVGAVWCEPCTRFHEAAEKGELDGDLGDLDLLVFDLNRDGERLSPFGYDSQYIPLFAVPGADGRATAKRVEGASKGEGAIAFIVPRLKTMLGR